MKIKLFPKSQEFFKPMNEYLEALASIEWFENVGSGELEGTIRAKDWKEAMKYSLEQTYHNFLTELDNATRMYASKLDMAKYQKQWSKSVDVINPVLSSAIDANLTAALKQNGVKDPLFLRLIRGKFLHELMLLAFCGERLESLASHCQYFFDGYCPCGYKGRSLKGTLIVY